MGGQHLTVGLAIAVLLAVAPALADHEPREVTVAGATIEDTVQPAGEPGSAELAVRVPCEDDERATVWTRAVPRRAPGFVEAETVDVETRSTDVCHDANDTLSVGIPVEVGVTTEAPAFEPTTVAYEVGVQKNHTNGTREDVGSSRANVTLTPGYYNLFNVRLETKILEAGPDERLAFPIEIVNRGNAMTEFTFEIANGESIPDGFEPVVPSKVVVERNATETVDLQVFTPFHNGYVSETASIEIVAHSAYASDPAIEGESATVSVLSKVSGFYVPAPGSLAILAVLPAAALLRRNPP